jgi:hypothetical protein
MQAVTSTFHDTTVWVLLHTAGAVQLMHQDPCNYTCHYTAVCMHTDTQTLGWMRQQTSADAPPKTLSTTPRIALIHLLYCLQANEVNMAAMPHANATSTPAPLGASTQ